MPHLEFSYRFHLPQVKRNLISAKERFLYELPGESPNNLRIKILGNIRKVLKLGGGIAQCPAFQKQNFKVSCPCPVLLDIFTLFQIFCSGLLLLRLLLFWMEEGFFATLYLFSFNSFSFIIFLFFLFFVCPQYFHKVAFDMIQSLTGLTVVFYQFDV